jgi:GNAT superfamily N-acetyltransferase
MPDLDQTAARREIADALVSALDRRHEVLDVVVEADDRSAAVAAIAALLHTSVRGAEAVMSMAFAQLTKDSRRTIAAELDNLNSQLTFTLQERPAIADDSLALKLFDPEQDRDIFAARLEEVGAAGDGSGRPAQPIDDELLFARRRIEQEDAAWFVAVVETSKVGMVFGELERGEVNVRIWIHPEHRKKGYGTAALRRSRSEMATYFPAVPMIVRAPGSNPA